jgi:hypothetical protein
MVDIFLFAPESNTSDIKLRDTTIPTPPPPSGGAQYWNGLSWLPTTIQYWNGLTYLASSAQYYNGSIWVAV